MIELRFPCTCDALPVATSVPCKHDTYYRNLGPRVALGPVRSEGVKEFVTTRTFMASAMSSFSVAGPKPTIRIMGGADYRFRVQRFPLPKEGFALWHHKNADRMGTKGWSGSYWARCKGVVDYEIRAVTGEELVTHPVPDQSWLGLRAVADPGSQRD
jgi:hypothetical protein